MEHVTKGAVSKVAAVTLGFWIIKILCTTLGETGGDAVTMTMNLGYLVGTAIFLSLLVALIVIQTKSETISSSSLLGNNYSFYNGWYDNGRLLRPFPWYRVYGWFTYTPCLCARNTCCMEMGSRNYLCKYSR